MLASCERSRLWRPGVLSEDTACPLKFSHRRAQRSRPSQGSKAPSHKRPTSFSWHTPGTNPTSLNDRTAWADVPCGFPSHSRRLESLADVRFVLKADADRRGWHVRLVPQAVMPPSTQSPGYSLTFEPAQRDVPRSPLFWRQADAVGGHPTQTIICAVYPRSHRVLDQGKDANETSP